MSTGKMPFRPGAREGLIETHLPLVRAVARRYVGRGAELDDLVQAGSVGLVKASRRFDPSRGITFAAFAAPTIEGEIRHHLRDRSGPIRVPRDLQALAARVRRDEPALAGSLGHPPSAAELAAALNVTVEQVQQVRGIAQLEAGTPVEDVATADPAAAPEDAAPTRILLAEQLRQLDERERQVVYLRFHRDLTERQIAREVGISQSQVSRLLARALGKLRAGADESPAIQAVDASPDPPPPARRAGQPPRSSTHSGRFLVRMPSELHEALARAAQDRDVSLNRYVVDALGAAVSGQAPAPRDPTDPRASESPTTEPRTTDPGPSRRTVRLLLAANTVVLVLAGLVTAALIALVFIQGG